MNVFFKQIQKDGVLQISFWLTIILVILICGLIGTLYTTLPPFVPLYNHMPWGYARLGKTYELFLLPLLLIFIATGNSIVGIKLLAKSPLLTRFLFITMVGVSIFTCIFLVRLILLTL